MQGFEFSILASGSTGNSMVIRNKEMTILVDAGLSARKIDQLLQQVDLCGEQIDAVFVTHEHSDHVKGLGAFARKYKPKVYANEKTWQAMAKQVGEIAEEQRQVLRTGEKIDFGSLEVESYPISHDAADPVGYCFIQGDFKLSLATDLGYVSPIVKEKVQHSDVLILESNHDVEMLRSGRYPWNIKRRILGDTGHLSNDAAGEALCELLGENTRRVYLAHLSQDHNMMDLAKLTVSSVLDEHGIHLENRKVRLMDTYVEQATKWDRVTD